MNISVVIPVLNEEAVIADTLRALVALSPHEIFVVDGGSTDTTREIAGEFAVRVLRGERGRARQMNSGAAAATGEILLFLHADTTLPDRAFAEIAAALDNPWCVGGRFMDSGERKLINHFVVRSSLRLLRDLHAV